MRKGARFKVMLRKYDVKPIRLVLSVPNLNVRSVHSSFGRFELFLSTYNKS